MAVRARKHLTVYERVERRVAPAAVEAALSGARRSVYWLDSPERPAPEAALTRDTVTDLLVVGGGFTGLWTALIAKERDPQRDVLVLEGHECGWAASGRNGGFLSTSLTHGRANGERHLPGEVDRLDELGLQNVREIHQAIERYRIDCDFDWSGSITVAIEARHLAELHRAHRQDPAATTYFDRNQMRAEIHSPLYLGGLWHHTESALVDPARLLWGLKRACLTAGVRIHEHSPVTGLTRLGRGPTARVSAVVGARGGGFPAAGGGHDGEFPATGGGHDGEDRDVDDENRGGDGRPHRGPGAVVIAKRVALATNVFRSLLARARYYTVPVYDYALITEPLSPRQEALVGWERRQGVEDPDSRFHYYRMTTDRPTGRPRILFGGYDAVHQFGRTVSLARDHRPATYRRLAAHFLGTFPQLEGIGFTHQWGGAVDTSSRFFPFFHTAGGGSIASAAGFTGLGVGASRFAARVLLDLLEGAETNLTRLQLVRSKPRPFPPEPFAWAGISITKRAMARADRRGGEPGPWLKAADRLGMGFDS